MGLAHGSGVEDLQPDDRRGSLLDSQARQKSSAPGPVAIQPAMVRFDARSRCAITHRCRGGSRISKQFGIPLARLGPGNRGRAEVPGTARSETPDLDHAERFLYMAG